MYELTSDRLAGPLRTIRDNAFYIEGFLELDPVKIGLIGDTYAGKTQAIRALTHTLGGVFQEKHRSKRTVKDGSYLFGETGSGQTIAVGLKSHAGHDVGKGDKGPRADKNILVLKYLKTSTFNRQFGIIEPIIEKEGIDYSDCSALVTRVTSEDQLPIRRKNMIVRKGFKHVYFVDNHRKQQYPLSGLDPANIHVVIDLAREVYPDLKLIYFGDEELPDSLEDKLVRFDDQLSFAAWDEKEDSEDKLARALFGDDHDAVLF